MLEKILYPSRTRGFSRIAPVFIMIFLIVLSVLFANFSFGSTSRFPSSKPVLAYYYGWYTKNSWYDGIGSPNSLAVADSPSIGLYDSQNTTVIDIQISEALSAGIDGFIASWWGLKVSPTTRIRF